MDDLAGAIVLMNNILKRIANFGEIRRILRQEMERRLRIRQDRSERLIDFVRNRAGKFAEHGDAHQMLNFQTLQRGLSLGRLLIGDVDEYAAPLFRLTVALLIGSGTHANPTHFPARQHNSDVADGRLLCFQ